MARERKFTQSELFQEVERLLLAYGYEGFTFSLLAENLDVSRGTIYKYFENKDELIIDFMIYEMESYLIELDKINDHSDFYTQFDYLFELMFKNKEIHQLIGIGKHMVSKNNIEIEEKEKKLKLLHLEMYYRLENFIKLGKKENIIKQELLDAVILGYIFQAISIPNHFQIPQEDWVKAIKEMIKYGMFSPNIQ